MILIPTSTVSNGQAKRGHPHETRKTFLSSGVTIHLVGVFCWWNRVLASVCPQLPPRWLALRPRQSCAAWNWCSASREVDDVIPARPRERSGTMASGTGRNHEVM